MPRGFEEVIEHTLRTLEDDLNPFDLFVEWMYMGGSPATRHHRQTDYETTSCPIFTRIKVYYFAENHFFAELMAYGFSSSEGQHVTPRDSEDIANNLTENVRDGRPGVRSCRSVPTRAGNDGERWKFTSSNVPVEGEACAYIVMSIARLIKMSGKGTGHTVLSDLKLAWE